MKLCNLFSLLQCVVLSPSQCLNLKALMRTLDKTKVSSIQGVVGGGALDILHGIEEHALKSFVEGLALGVELVGRKPRRTRARAGLWRPHVIHLQ